MVVPTFVWIATIVGIVGLLGFDFLFHVRQAHEPTLRESAIWSAIIGAPLGALGRSEGSDRRSGERPGIELGDCRLDKHRAGLTMGRAHASATRRIG